MLKDAFDLALAQSEPVRLAEQSVVDAEIRLTDTWTVLGPSATAFATGTYQRKIGVPAFRPTFAEVGGGQIIQPLFRREFFAARTAAKLGIESAEAAASRRREQLMQNVVAAFVGVLRAREQVVLIKTAVARADAALQFARARVKGGGALRSAELLASLDLRGNRLNLIAAGRDAELAEDGLAFLINEPVPGQLILPLLPKVPSLVEALATAENARTDLRSLAKKTLDARAYASAARGRLWPRLDLQADAQIRDPYYTQFFGDNPAQVFGFPGEFDWHVIGVLTVPLFQTGVEYTEIARRDSAAYAAELQEQLQLKVVHDDVKRAGARLEAAIEAIGLAEEQIRDASQHYALVLSQFKLGAVTFLEVDTAQALLTQAEIQKVVATYDRVQAVYDFLFAVGILEL
jgi:outer membrane protein